MRFSQRLIRLRRKSA